MVLEGCRSCRIAHMVERNWTEEDIGYVLFPPEFNLAHRRMTAPFSLVFLLQLFWAFPSTWGSHLSTPSLWGCHVRAQEGNRKWIEKAINSADGCAHMGTWEGDVEVAIAAMIFRLLWFNIGSLGRLCVLAGQKDKWRIQGWIIFFKIIKSYKEVLFIKY